MINRVTLVGRLGHEVELRCTNNGTPVTRLRIATDGSYKNAEGVRIENTDWHSVIVFGRSAENCAAYIGKGSLVYVEGALKTRKWISQDKIERYATEVVSRRIQFLDFRHTDGQSADAVPTPPPDLMADDSGLEESMPDMGINDMRD
ncbi:single-stranded DNA-binding protein [Desulfovibrio sp. ZJ200]|uniref:single-stranded DNA-binding protein n=1 Tax=Desulfovibrio sp. ZJ200 TaxID=2709792 RepID=UPI0013EDFF44|nr:single-stranded DNA-binding protein [Desulfovibrio sp. ZJ200]